MQSRRRGIQFLTYFHANLKIISIKPSQCSPRHAYPAFICTYSPEVYIYENVEKFTYKIKENHFAFATSANVIRVALYRFLCYLTFGVARWRHVSYLAMQVLIEWLEPGLEFFWDLNHCGCGLFHWCSLLAINIQIMGGTFVDCKLFIRCPGWNCGW